MIWNIYYLDKQPGRMVARYIGQVDAPGAKVAEMKAAAKCWDVSGAGSERYVARNPATDDWRRPLATKGK